MPKSCHSERSEESTCAFTLSVRSHGFFAALRMTNGFLRLLVVATTFGHARAAEPDFAAAHAETIETLKNFVHVDTTNPPGNETRGAEFLKAIL